MGLSSQQPTRRAIERNIVFVDESGRSTRPHQRRSWAPHGKTPVLQETFNWDKLSLTAGIDLRQFSFRIYEGSINGKRTAEFLQALQRHNPGKLLAIRDGAAIHPLSTGQGRPRLQRRRTLARVTTRLRPGA